MACYSVEEPGEDRPTPLALLPEYLALYDLGTVGELIGLLIHALVTQRRSQLAIGSYGRPEEFQLRCCLSRVVRLVFLTPLFRRELLAGWFIRLGLPGPSGLLVTKFGLGLGERSPIDDREVGPAPAQVSNPHSAAASSA